VAPRNRRPQTGAARNNSADITGTGRRPGSARSGAARFGRDPASCLLWAPQVNIGSGPAPRSAVPAPGAPRGSPNRAAPARGTRPGIGGDIRYQGSDLLALG